MSRYHAIHKIGTEANTNFHFFAPSSLGHPKHPVREPAKSLVETLEVENHHKIVEGLFLHQVLKFMVE